MVRLIANALNIKVMEMKLNKKYFGFRLSQFCKKYKTIHKKSIIYLFSQFSFWFD